MTLLTKLRCLSRLAAMAVKGLVLGAALTALPAAQAADRPILHLEGADSGKAVDLSLADLQALGPVRFDTSTPWTDGVVTFEGVPLAQVLELVRSGETILQATALNDYVIDMPVDEVLGFEPILAWSQDGALMSVRQRGPLWLVFDFDRFPETQNEVFLSRSIWQLKTLRLLD